MNHQNTLSHDILAATGVNSARCYQCGKCSAGCPLAADMDFTSNTVMRMLQVEDEQTDKDLLRSEAIWLCVSCEMCISRCPMAIDIPKVMDYLRQRSIREGLPNKHAKRNIIPFHRAFLDMIRFTGRSYEAGLVVDYKLRTKHFFQDLTLAPKMLLHGKLPLFPELIKQRNNIRRIFKKTQNLPS
ncbi:MAG: 4Fe-4S dicluster domain-containing protein [Dysgonamonadaceae bacterium]|jgi:heterodisulfide reductase subunit C|nr:4Fe-4S dicluster domain-containing protein [Dysgonamonadaceae bacterium]